MRNFQFLAKGLDTSGLCHALYTRPALWNTCTIRTRHSSSPHQPIDDILLRYSPYRHGDDFIDKVCCSLDAVDYPAWYELAPYVEPFVFGLMARVKGVRLGRVIISRVAPGAEIPLHSDRIEEVEHLFPDREPLAVYYDRYQVSLQSAPGVVFDCGDESVHMATGEAWWFDNNKPHRVFNGSAIDRLALIVDIRLPGRDRFVPIKGHPTAIEVPESLADTAAAYGFEVERPVGAK